ncbi:uncharacterized protein DS421_19g655520 [Arachis hypogaea]|uniref:Uncharacterized protein n=1 Tax=Arachis hypogaea TaxID=3818 RepID=A0A6B9V936_ARAHY|nr:uncharacterized protein DS421_19g655520 [Arachis hypogaea]
MPSPCFGLFVHWRATPGRSSDTPNVPRHAAQVARPYICGLFRLGVPRLDPQVARPSDFLELVCHAFDTKWHAIVKVPPGVVTWRAMPLGPSGTPVSHAQLLCCFLPFFMPFFI